MGRNRESRAKWIRHSHLFRGDTYECSRCGYTAGSRQERCPECDSLITGDKYDPQWVDELEMFDAIFDD